MIESQIARETRRKPDEIRRYVRRHLRFGWWLILAFLTLGIVLEGLHAFKSGWYLDAAHESRRLMWSLAHAHGTLFGVLHLAFAMTCALSVDQVSRRQAVASSCLMAASLLIPLGFLLGGISIYGGDPGHGIVLVPIGAFLLFMAVLLTALIIRVAPMTD